MYKYGCPNTFGPPLYLLTKAYETRDRMPLVVAAKEHEFRFKEQMVMVRVCHAVEAMYTVNSRLPSCWILLFRTHVLGQT